MVISIFTPPEEGKEWSACKTGDICDCLTFEYEKFFNGAGTFTAEIPVNSRFREKVLVNSILVTSDGDALIVKNIQTTLDKVKITGYDLNGLLLDRVTMPTDNDGTDPVSGTTEYCVKHYVSFNLEACEKDINRNLPRFGVAENLDRGIADDHNMPRLQNVHDVVTEMCGAAKLGWRVQLQEKAGTNYPVFVFDVSEQVDRSVNQSERDRVIFSVQQHNVSSMTREVGVTAAKNALYLDIDGKIVGYPSGDTKGRAVAVGYDRREEYCSLSGDSLREDVYSVEAEQNMADRMAETDSLTIEAGSPLDYRKRYDVGTIVTVYDRNRSLQLDSVISAVTVRRSGNEYSVKLTLGESKPKVLDQYVRKGEATSTAVRNSKAPVVGLTEYKYLTDLSVKFNGTTYTAEKDSATGLISRISDDAGNEFEPTINSGITDVAMHNAVFWAVAMCRGLALPTRTMLYDSGNEYQSITGGWELNIVTGGTYFADCVASSKSDGVLYGKLTATSSVPTNKKMGNVSFTTSNQISLAGYSKVCAAGEWFIELANSGARNCDLILVLFANEPTPDTPASAVSAKYRRRTDDSEFGVVRHVTYEFDVSDLDSSHYIGVNIWGTTWLGDTTVASTNAYFKVSKIWLEK